MTHSFLFHINGKAFLRIDYSRVEPVLGSLGKYLLKIKLGNRNPFKRDEFHSMVLVMLSAYYPWSVSDDQWCVGAEKQDILALVVLFSNQISLCMGPTVLKHIAYLTFSIFHFLK